ncbi:N-acetylmuramoyl-L-alanine amidase [Haloimpatiens lingqiaonensis]|uniref:N-acetylmuramoyl-L-alanine amidase n=1 Tax=Haloimpatiens lingqiaonensis TaxID=1380675 RepID=UPI0010FE62DC|nr:N-acetylmuramoyl-L-alanine amidase [Haloimpatiens lingqiaonensis]
MCSKKRRFHVIGTIVMVMFLLLGFNFNVKAVEPNNLTSIMGQAQLTKYQALEYFKSYNSDKDLRYVEDFISIVWEEGAVEGVRPDLAFIQMMKETNFLRFTGDVKEEQNNFAGIGAIGNGAPGNSFSDVRTGIRCIIQHLKAYASTESLVQECVDPRFEYVQRGITPYVEWLAIGANPNYPDKGWAADPNYGTSIVYMLSCAAKFPAGDCRAVVQSLEVSLNGLKVSNPILHEGKNYTIKAEAKSGNEVLYQFWIKDLSKNLWTMIRDYSTTNTTTWTSNKAGKYLVGVHVKDKYSKERLENHRYDEYTVQASKATVTNLEVSLGGVKVTNGILEAGKNYSIKSEATSKNGALYQFWIKDLSKNLWTMIRDYSSTNTTTWTSNKAGKYLVGVHVKDKYSKERLENHRYDEYMVQLPKATVTNLEVSLGGVKVTNGILEAGKNYSIKSEATSKNGALYQFWIKDLSKNLWTMIRDYSSTNTTTWTSNKSGKYLVGVHVKDKYSKERLENHRYDEYMVQLPKATVTNLEVSLGGVKVTNGILEAGKNYSIKSEATSKNGALYQFWIKDLSKNLWTMIRDYSSTNTTTWTSNKAGKYLVGVHVKDKYSKERLENHRYDEYMVQLPKATVTNLEVSLGGVKVTNGILEAGKNYSIKSEATSKNGALYQFWIKDLSKNLWTMIRDYSSTNTTTWTSNKAGKYLVGVHVKDKYSKERLENHRYDEYMVQLPKATVTNLEVSLGGVKVTNGILEAGKNYSIKSEATSKNGALYQFWIKDLSKNLWTMIRDYSSTNTTTWTSNKSGKYLVGVHVKDKYSKERLENHRYDEYMVQLPKATVTNLEVSLGGVKVTNGILEAGKNYSIKSEATSKNGALYQFWIKDLSKNLWTMIRDYSGTNTTTWTSNKAGKYLVGVHVKDKYSKERLENHRYDEYAVNGLTIVLDAGHGLKNAITNGVDCGAVSSANTGYITEADLNQRLTLKLGKILETFGYNIVYTRDNIPSTYNSIGEELENRVAVANNIGADLFISIHHDSADVPSASGISTHYSSYRPRVENLGVEKINDIYYDNTPCDAAIKSKELSQTILNNLVSLGFNNRGNKDHNLYVTKNTIMTSVLIEAGFMSNDSEVTKISESTMESKIAEKIADAIKFIFDR